MKCAELKKRIQTLQVLIFVAFLAAPVIAVQGATLEDQKNILETITVTAQKREENVRDVPMNISVFSDIALEDAGIENVSDLVAFTPNLHLKESSAENILVIRGVSSFDSSIYSPAGMYVDGVNIPLHYMYNMELLDLERVEVLRGPQGTLYGRNSESGVMNLVTRQPDNEFRARISSEYASFDSLRLNANISGPVTGTLFFGIATQYKTSDGYMENLYNKDNESGKKDRKDGRLTLRWMPTDQWDLAYIAEAMDTDDQQNSYHYRTGPYATEPYKIRHNLTDEYSNQEGLGQTLKAVFKGKAFDIVSITGFRQYSHEYDTDMDCTDDPGLWNWGASPHKYDLQHLSEELRFSSPRQTRNIKWLAGIYGFRESVDIKNEMDAWDMKANTDMDINGFAVFGQGTLPLTEKFQLTAGLRFDFQKIKGTMTGTGASGAVINHAKDLDYEELLPKLTFSYDFNENMMTYASASKGYMVGGYNYGYIPVNQAAFTYDPEYTWNYEAGVKTSWRANTLGVNLSVFYIEINDKQVVQWSSTLGTRIENAAEACARGVELEFQARPFQGLELFAGLGYTRSRFDDWQSLQPDGSIYDFKGKSLPNSPDYTCQLGAAYRHNTGLFARMDFLGTGKFYGDPKNNLKQKAYGIVNLRLGYETDDWDIILSAKNLFDEEYVTALYDNTPMGLGELVQDGEPRTIGFAVTYRF